MVPDEIFVPACVSNDRDWHDSARRQVGRRRPRGFEAAGESSAIVILAAGGIVFDCRRAKVLLILTFVFSLSITGVSTSLASITGSSLESSRVGGLAGRMAPPADLVQGEGAGGGWCTQNGGYVLGAHFDGIYACGPAYGTSSPFDSIGFQCVELSARFLWAVYGRYATNVPDGKDFVAVSHQELGIPVGYPGLASLPAVGDIVSLRGAAGTLPYGHTAVVTSVRVNGQGNGSIQLMEENGQSRGWNQISVQSWSESYSSPGSYYYYNHVTWLKLVLGSRVPIALPSKYAVTPLGPYTVASGINDKGQVTGDLARTSSQASPSSRPFLFTSGRLAILTPPIGAGATGTSNAINANGALAITANSTRGAQLAFAYAEHKQNQWRLLPQPIVGQTAESALGINAWGDMAGWVSSAMNRIPTLAVAWIHRTGTYVPLTYAPSTGYAGPIAYASDAAGDAVGSQLSTARLLYPVLWVSGGRAEILPGATGTPQPGAARAMYVKTVNGVRSVTVAGWLQVTSAIRQAAVWTVKILSNQQVVAGRPALLPATAGYRSSVANGLDGPAEAVGHATATGGAARGFVWIVGKGVYDLNNRVRKTSGWVVTGARGINTAGQIVAQGYWRNPSGPQILQALILSPAKG